VATRSRCWTATSSARTSRTASASRRKTATRTSRAGATVVVSAISPYEEARRRARALVEENAPFVEIHVATPIEVCAERDPKGLYAKARTGEIEHFTGVSDPYEEPSAPELRLHTEGNEPAQSAALVIARLEELELTRAPEAVS
jgi:adenylylsulfate kinase-like enzyme